MVGVPEDERPDGFEGAAAVHGHAVAHGAGVADPEIRKSYFRSTIKIEVNVILKVKKISPSPPVVNEGLVRS